MKPSTSLLLVILLTGCASITTPPTIEPVSIPTGRGLALTKAFAMTAEAAQETENSPKNDATVTAIIATKYAGGTQAAGTMTAVPTPTLTPAIPTGSPLCVPANLKTSFGSNGATGNITLGLSFTNIGPSPCYMQAWPQVILVDRQENPLDVEYSYFDFNTDASSAATEQARQAATAKVGLWPGWAAGFMLIWGNWCGGPIIGGVVVRLTLANHAGTIAVPTDVSAGGRCDASNYRSHVSISKLNLAPPSK